MHAGSQELQVPISLTPGDPFAHRGPLPIQFERLGPILPTPQGVRDGDDSRPHAFRDHGLGLDAFGVVLGEDHHQVTVLDAQLGGVSGVDLDPFLRGDLHEPGARSGPGLGVKGRVVSIQPEGILLLIPHHRPTQGILDGFLIRQPIEIFPGHGVLGGGQLLVIDQTDLLVRVVGVVTLIGFAVILEAAAPFQHIPDLLFLSGPRDRLVFLIAISNVGDQQLVPVPSGEKVAPFTQSVFAVAWEPHLQSDVNEDLLELFGVLENAVYYRLPDAARRSEDGRSHMGRGVVFQEVAARENVVREG